MVYLPVQTYLRSVYHFFVACKTSRWTDFDWTLSKLRRRYNGRPIVSLDSTCPQVLSVLRLECDAGTLLFLFTFCWGQDGRYREYRIWLRSGLLLPALVGYIGQAYRGKRANAGFGFLVFATTIAA